MMTIKDAHSKGGYYQNCKDLTFRMRPRKTVCPLVPLSVNCLLMGSGHDCEEN